MGYALASAVPKSPNQDEKSETLVVTLSGPTYSTIGSQNPATVRIVHGDAYRIYLPHLLRHAVP